MAALSKRSGRYLADLERARLQRLEAQAKARQERAEVSQGVVERMQLGDSRGEAFEAPKAGRGERDKPVRRLTGLQWLERQGKLQQPRLEAAEAYASAYQMAAAEPRLRSCIAESQGGAGDNHVMGMLAWRRSVACTRLANMRSSLGNQPQLVEALDLICGQEKTPREAARNGTEAARLEVACLIALDLLAEAAK